MMTARAAWLALLALLLLPTSQGAINGDHAFEADYPFMEGLKEELTVVSGAAQLDIQDATGAFGFFDTTGFDVRGLEQVCWDASAPKCEQGDLTLRILPGGSVAIDFPGTVDAAYEAEHALGLFVDFGNREDLNSYDISTTFLAPAVGGHMSFDKVDDIPFAGFFDLRSLGGLAGLDDTTIVRLLDGDAPVQDFQGKDALMNFAGSPEVTSFRTDLVALPFEVGSTARFEPAAAGAATAGLKLERINELLADMAGAREGGGDGSELQIEEISEVEKVLAEVMNGALLRIPLDGNASVEETFALVRFDALAIEAGSQDRLSWSGVSPLAVQNGQVVGAPDLVGVGFFALPLWSIILWVVAIGLWIARLVVQPPKEHERWDRYKWVGWVFGAVAFVVLFVLWDFEVRHVWGTSLFSTDAGGAGLGVTAAVQLAPLLYVLFAAAAPIRMILKNGLLLSKQGTFMGVSTGIGYLMAYVLGATLLLAYVELIVSAVMENLGG